MIAFGAFFCVVSRGEAPNPKGPPMNLDKLSVVQSVSTLAFAAVVALTLTSCGEEDTPMAPAATGFSLANYFTDDEAVVEVGGSNTSLRMVGVQFTDRNSTTLTAASLPVLDKFRTVFEKLPGARYRIESHTDDVGAQAFNLDLTEQRANLVRNYFFTELGGPTAYITAAFFGEDQPIANNSTPEGRAINNRIDIYVQNSTGDPVFTVTLTADRLEVYQDCDAMGGSPSSAAGDFYIAVKLNVVENGTQTLLSQTVNHLVQLNDGESAELDIHASGQFIASNDARLETVVSIFENDTDGHQFDRVSRIIFFYDLAAGCWKQDDGTDACTGNSPGDIAAERIVVEQVPGDPCRARLGWRLQAERVNR
jgi:outer membrane protein OmpA-like peptidoglycan-associated protein